MLKIYGANLSSPANKVRMTANYLEIPYEYVRVNLRGGEHRTAEFLKLHPAGKVPVIDDEGFVLFESDAIVKYLAVSRHSPIYPDGVKERALVDQWMNFATIHVGGAMGKVLYNRVFAPVIKVPVDENSLEDGQKFLSRFLPVVDRQLAASAFLAANTFTLADIVLLATIDPAEAAGIDVTPYTHIVKWRGELKQKEFYTKCHASYDEALKNMMAQAT